MVRRSKLKDTGVGVLSLHCSLLLTTILPLFTSSFSDAFSLATATTSARTSDVTSIISRPDDEDLVREQLGYLPLNYQSVTARTSLDGSPVAIKTYPLLRKKKKKKMNDHDKEKDSIEPLTLSLMSSGVFAPFPTQYWLTNPEIGRAIGEIERQGYIGWIEDYLNLECNFLKRNHLWWCHEQSGIDRWESLTASDRQFFLQHADTHSTVKRMKDILCNSGIAGTAYRVVDEDDDDGVVREVSIKCLHTHYAHFRSTTDTNCERNNDLHSSSTSSYSHPDDEAPENPIGRIVHHLLETKFPTLDL